MAPGAGLPVSGSAYTADMGDVAGYVSLLQGIFGG
jgi:hypothetical protein